MITVSSASYTVDKFDPRDIELEHGYSLANLVYYLWKPMMWSMEKASTTSIYLATSDEVKGMNGTFWGNLKEHDIKGKFKVQSEMDAVWDYCRKVCGE